MYTWKILEENLFLDLKSFKEKPIKSENCVYSTSNQRIFFKTYRKYTKKISQDKFSSTLLKSLEIFWKFYKNDYEFKQKDISHIISIASLTTLL